MFLFSSSLLVFVGALWFIHYILILEHNHYDCFAWHCFFFLSFSAFCFYKSCFVIIFSDYFPIAVLSITLSLAKSEKRFVNYGCRTGILAVSDYPCNPFSPLDGYKFWFLNDDNPFVVVVVAVYLSRALFYFLFLKLRFYFNGVLRKWIWLWSSLIWLQTD